MGFGEGGEGSARWLVVRIDRQGRFEVAARLRGVTSFHVQQRYIDMRRRQRRVEPEGVLVLVHRLVIVPFRRERAAQSVVCLGEVRIARQRLAILDDGFRRAAGLQ